MLNKLAFAAMALLMSAQVHAVVVTPTVEENLCFDGANWSAMCGESGGSGVRVSGALSINPGDVGSPGAVGITAYMNGQGYMLNSSGNWVQYVGTPIQYAYFNAMPSVINLPKIYEGEKCAYQNVEIYVGYGVLSSVEVEKIDNYHKQKNPKISREHLVGLYTYLNGERNNKFGLVYSNTSQCSSGG